MSPSRHTAAIAWARGDARFADGRYSRRHVWRFDGGAEVPASSSPHSVRLPYSSAECVDPEEAFVASISSCHMLWFLSIAARRGYVVDSYDDAAEGFLEKAADGRAWMARVTLHPVIAWCGERVPTQADIAEIHDAAHHACYIANSVRAAITVEKRIEDPGSRI